MEQDLSHARNYFAKFDQHTADNLVRSDDLTMVVEDNLKVCYAPFDYIERNARLVIVGITPGFTQAASALGALAKAKANGETLIGALEQAKKIGSFSGPLRSNLVAMLDHIGLNNALGLRSTSEMFQVTSRDVHFTSALRYPVFVNGENYSGSPAMLKVPALFRMVETYLAEEARILSNAIWLPLGPIAEKAVMHLVKKGELSSQRVLTGMPHPSGANAERVAVFVGRKPPEAASKNTNANKLLCAAERLTAQVTGLSKKGAAV